MDECGNICEVVKTFLNTRDRVETIQSYLWVMDVPATKVVFDLCKREWHLSYRSASTMHTPNADFRRECLRTIENVFPPGNLEVVKK